MGVGCLLVFFGVSLFASRLVRPLSRVVQPIGTWSVAVLSLFLLPVWLLRWIFRRSERPSVLPDRTVAALAGENTRRNPARTASTASALMIGLALVTLVAMLASGITTTFNDAVNKLFRADYAITSSNNFTPISPAVGLAAAKLPGVTGLGAVRVGTARIYRKNTQVSAVTPGISPMIALDWIAGSPKDVLAHLGSDGAVVDKDYANKHHLALGSTIPVITPTGKTLQLVVRGIFDPPPGGSPFQNVTFSAATFDATYQQPQDLFAFVNTAGGASAATTAKLEAGLKAFPNAKVQTRDQFKKNQIAGLKSVLNILYVLLALSVIVSLFGIVNTLVLTVFERTRELGMLRAVGMTRRQMRRMIRYESVNTALIGAVLGIVLGIVLASLLVARVKFISFAPPVVSLIVFAIVAVIAGVFAAIFPARRAARLNVLEALQYE
jgi:putative ABC transport system permease protein